MTQHLSIGDLAKATETKIETIRYYERIGLLPEPARTSGNYRSYETAHFLRLGFIRRARELGFSIEQVRELLSLSDQKDRSCAQVDAIAREHLAEVDEKISSLKSLRRELDAIIRQCHSGTIKECRIIDALGAKPVGNRSQRSEQAIRTRKRRTKSRPPPAVKLLAESNSTL